MKAEVSTSQRSSELTKSEITWNNNDYADYNIEIDDQVMAEIGTIANIDDIRKKVNAMI